jgi:hypothetical protein
MQKSFKITIVDVENSIFQLFVNALSRSDLSIVYWKTLEWDDQRSTEVYLAEKDNVALTSDLVVVNIKERESISIMLRCLGYMFNDRHPTYLFIISDSSLESILSMGTNEEILLLDEFRKSGRFNIFNVAEECIDCVRRIAFNEN